MEKERFIPTHYDSGGDVHGRIEKYTSNILTTPIQTFAACFTAVEQQLLVGLLQVERDASLENDRDAAHVTLVENVVAKLGGTLEKY